MTITQLSQLLLGKGIMLELWTAHQQNGKGGAMDVNVKGARIRLQA